MSRSYNIARLLLGGEEASSRCTALEYRFYSQLTDAEAKGVSYREIFNLVHAVGSPALRGSSWLTEKVLGDPYYRICADVANRVGIRAGLLRGAGLEEHHPVEALA